MADSAELKSLPDIQRLMYDEACDRRDKLSEALAKLAKQEQALITIHKLSSDKAYVRADRATLALIHATTGVLI